MDTALESNQSINGNTFELKDVNPEQSCKDQESGTYETLDAVASNFATASTGHQIDGRCETADGHDLHLLPDKKSKRKKLVYTIAKVGFVAVMFATLAVVVGVFLSSRNDASNECVDYSLSNGKVVKVTGSREGDILQVECSSTSKLVGSATITCYSTGQWSDYPRCIPKECHGFETPPNGKVIFRNTSTRIGAIVLVTCKEGFVRKGVETVVCQSNETWSESPACEPVDCEFPQKIENGEIKNMTGTTYNNTFAVVCPLGYRHTGVSTVICEQSGMWSEFPLCNAVACGIPGIPKNGHIKSLNGTSFGSMATLQCDESFFMSGSPTISCTADGNWTALPKCERKENKHGLDCGAPSSVENGEIGDMTGTKINRTFSVRCFKGYKLKGNRTVICGEDGTWSDMPDCLPVSCGSPHIPSNGYVVSKTGTTFKASALISCNEGYYVSGNQEIRCMGSGQWTSIPTCERKDCAVPSNVTNGKIKGLTGTKYNDSFSVECTDDYILVGQESVRCDTNGNWTHIPACIAQPNCGVPPSIRNGEIIGVTNTNIFYVNCNNGYRLTGENTLSCDMNGKWTTLPTCQLIECGTPKITHGSIVGLFNTSYGSLLSVSCNEGYSLFGENTIKCDEDGEWKNIPTCEILTCGIPKVPVNGAVDLLQGTKVNNTVSFRCNPGFHLNGTRIIICSSNGKWTEGPKCLPDCDDLPRIENGRISINSSYNIFSVQCSDGYILSGDNIIKCTSNGEWTALPSCEPVSCGIPEIPHNGMLLTISGTKFNAVASMKCDEGFSLTGNYVITCLSNGSWTWIPRCIQIDCSTPNITHGSITGSTNTTFGSTIHVTCNEGYSLTGPDTIQCGIGGQWSTRPTCKQVTCGLPEIPANGAIGSIQGTTSNKTAMIKCHAGFVLNGTGLVTCSGHGKWTESPTCIPECGIPRNITNGEIKGLTGTTYNSSFSVECNEGYMLAGSTTVECKTTGTWSELPACISRTDCGVPPNITNGEIKGLTSIDNKDTFSVQCNNGYILNGNKTVRCDIYGKWTNMPSCNPVSCGIPKLPENRRLTTLSGTTFQSTARMECDLGFVMAGNSTVTCLSNGSWTWIPACNTIDCGLPNITNGVIKGYTDARYGSIFYATCNKGYSLIGYETVQCGRDGQWNLPACKFIPCGLPEIPENGAIDSINGTISNRTVLISCNTGFLLNGSNVVTCFSHGIWTKSPTCKPVSDCYDVYLESNMSLSGIYNVTQWQSKQKIQVYCDMETDGGGWTVFQYRYDGSVDFYNNFNQYVNGFGNLSGEFWLGLKYIKEMVSQSKTKLRIDLSAANGTTAYETFKNFYLYGSTYQLRIDRGTGSAGDGLSYNHYRSFSTYDRDYDSKRSGSCAAICHGGWWYRDCSYVNLNGEYLTPGTHILKGSETNGMVYLAFISNRSLKSSKMMFRRELLCESKYPCDLKYTPPSK